MNHDHASQFRPILEQDPPRFLDRVNTPWDPVPDLEEYNQNAYQRIVRALKGLARSNTHDEPSNSQGILVLGEAGTGKTHLLMRVARNLSKSNHILFVRKPNNEDAVAQHVWASIVNSLSRSLPESGTNGRSQLEDLLAHVFTRVLLPELEKDIRDGTGAAQTKWRVDRLKGHPYNLFTMIGERERRQANIEILWRKTREFLHVAHPDVDLKIVRVLFAYCFVSCEDHKRVLLTWLSGQDVDESEARELDLPLTWVTIDETSSEASTQQQREELALRAIRTIGILSTYYQPLILAFDQLEGLRDQVRLTQRWGDTVREIFTMTPNLLIVTCIFPSLWRSWFSANLDRSVAGRIAQQDVILETFGPRHANELLAIHLAPGFAKYGLPTSIYPFTGDDVTELCSQADSPRSFIQAARRRFESWLDGDTPAAQDVAPAELREVVPRETINALLSSALDSFKNEHLAAYKGDFPIEQDFFGRVRNITETLVKFSDQKVSFARATCGSRVMPPNLLLKPSNGQESVCLAILYGEGTSFAARIRNLNSEMQTGREFRNAVILRDSRCMQICGKVSQEYIEEFSRLGGLYLTVGGDEISTLNAIYDTLVTIEERDLSLHKHVIDMNQFVQFLRGEGICRRTELFQALASRSDFLDRAIRLPAEPPVLATMPVTTPAPSGGASSAPMKPGRGTRKTTRATTSVPRPTPSEASSAPMKPGRGAKKNAGATASKPAALAQILIGDSKLDSAHVGIVGKLKEDGRTVAISFAKPQCMVLLGYMGTGKSYGLGVVIENALLSVPGLSSHSKPLCVVAFNFRRRPDTRFEYSGFRRPNTSGPEIARLRDEYKAKPAGIERVNVFGYGPELQRRRSEYDGLPTFPIQFRADELGAEHWEILMKPPNPQAEYMGVVRDIIQKLFYEERLSYKNLEQRIQTDDRLTRTQKGKAEVRLSFAKRWLCDERSYEWADVLKGGTMNVFDLRMQTQTSEDALKLCLIVTDLVRRTKNGVNKIIVFDEAHEYVESKELVGELENAIKQIRHDGLSFILASQSPQCIPDRIFKFLLTRMIFKLPDRKAINYLRKAAPNLDGLSPQQVSNLNLEQGVCFIQTDDDCTDPLLRNPQLLAVRPRCSQHDGQTIRIGPTEPSPGEISNGRRSPRPSP